MPAIARPMEVPMMPDSRERRIDDAIGAEALLQAVGDAEDAAVEADVFAEDHDAFVRAPFPGRGRG